MARAAGQILSDHFGQTVVVDNRAGGSGVIGTEVVANAPADGYTILSYADAILLLGVTKRVTFDVLKVFEPIVTMTSQPYVLVIQPNLPIKNLKDFVAYSQKVTLTYGSSGIAGTVHLGMERLAQMSGAKLMHVPFKGTAPSLVAVMGGEINDGAVLPEDGVNQVETIAGCADNLAMFIDTETLSIPVAGDRREFFDPAFFPDDWFDLVVGKNRGLAG